MSDKMREEFEEWFYKELSVAGGVYHLAWQAWQASRQVLVVELPESWEDGFDTFMDAEMVKKSLDSAGIKWTE